MIIGREYFLDYKLIKVCSRPDANAGPQVNVAKSKRQAGVMIIGREYFLDYKLIKVCSRPGSPPANLSH